MGRTPPPPEVRSQAAQHILSLPEFVARCHAKPDTLIVEGMIPSCSIVLLVGDSGLGKTPWAYQLALCVAAGVPFLGHQVTPGLVLHVDLENGESGIATLCESLARYLGLESLPKNYHLLTDREGIKALDDAMKKLRPTLVIIDSLRAFRPGAEQKNDSAAQLMNDLRQWAKTFNTTFLLIHHIRKPDEKFTQDALEDAPSVMTWLLRASGARALVNQSDVRIALDSTLGVVRIGLPKGAARAASDEVGLVVRGFTRLRGELGPEYLTRDRDEDGTPLGYRKLSGVELLFNSEQEHAFLRLPDQFAFREAKAVYQRADQPTTDFLQKCIRVGILRKPAKGVYAKVGGDGVSGASV